MKKIIRNIRQWFWQLLSSFAKAIHRSVTDVGVIIFFFLLPTAYPVVYTLIYNPEVVTKMPVAVVDHDRSERSRHFIRMADATPAIDIYSYCADIEEARRQMAAGEVFGVFEIPSDYASTLGRGEQAHVQFYCQGSLLLRYRTFTSALADLQMALASDISAERVSILGAEGFGSVLPVDSRSNFLGDVEQGFASFVMPGIVVLILQQSMLLGICMLAGTERERRRRNGFLVPEPEDSYSPSAVVWGRALAFTLLYVPGTVYILHIIPEIFSLPHMGSIVESLIFIFPMLLAAAFLGQTLGRWMTERESAFILLVFTSPLFLFLSGLTWPRYAMNWFWTFLSDLVPATWGVEGFVRINSNNASLAENSHAYLMLWLLVVAYSVTAWLVTRRRR